MSWYNPLTWIGTKKRAEILFGSEVFPIGKDIVLIGRSINTDKDSQAIIFPENGNLRIAQNNFTLGVSGKHAQLKWVKDKKKYEFEDAGSKKGSKINDKSVTPGNTILLENKDKITLGKVIKLQIIYN